MTLGDHKDTDKIRFDLIPSQVLWEVAEVLTYGLKKYEDRNWERGIAWNRIFGSVQRHLWAFWSGEDKDKESGLSHLAHAIVNCMFLLEYEKTHPELDNRVKKNESKT
jgi:hypothetical protein